MQMTCSAIKRALSEHLTAQLDVSQIRDMCVATLPIQTIDNRWVDVFIESRAADFYLIHDGGKAVNELILQGLRVTPSIERDFGSIAERFGIAFSDEMFQTGTKINRLAESVNAVGICSALAMTQLLESVRTEDRSLDKQILGLLKRWSKGKGRVNEHVKVAGELKQHEFDFTVIPKKGPVIAISMLNPTAGALSAAERFGFRAQDLRGTPYAKWKRVAVEAKAEVWSHDARKIVERYADGVLSVRTGFQPTYEELDEVLQPIVA